MRLYGLRIANLALFALCSFLVASVFNQIAAEMLIPMRASTAQSVAPRLDRAPTWQDRKVVVDRNLFGSKLGSNAVAVAPPPQDVDLEETSLPVKLLGTVAGANQSLSTAAVSDTTTRQHQILRVGDFLEGREDVRVSAIERKRIVLQNGLRMEELLLDEEAVIQPPPRAAKRRAPTRRRRTAAGKPGERSRSRRTAQKLEERVRELETELSGAAQPVAGQVGRLGAGTGSDQEASTTPSLAADIFSQARMLPKYENGEVAGLEFSAIEAESVFQKAGLENGDVVTEVNGVPINSVAATSRVLTEFGTVQDYNITVRGPAGVRTLNVPAAQVAEYLK
jgi:type II secretion system protein C